MSRKRTFLIQGATTALVLALLTGCSSKSSSPTAPSGGTGTAGKWTLFTVDSSASVGDYSHIAVDSAGHVAISYYDATTYQVRCAQRVGGSWVISDLGAGGAYGGKNSIALRPNGNPVVSYERHGVGYFWTAWNGSTWSGPTAISDPEPTSAPGDNGIGVDPLTGTVRGAMALWKSSGPGSGSLLGIWSSSTSAATVVDGPNMNGIYVGATGTQTSATVDVTGRLHVAYQFQVGFGTRFLKYGKLEGGTWTAAILDSMTGDEQGGNAYFSSVTAIAADGTGAPGIVYTGPQNGDYKYARWNGSAWTVSVIDPYGGRGQSLAYDRSGNPHVALCQGSYKLTYAHLVGSSWVEEAVDPNEGVSCSIGVDGSGKVYISYYDETLQRLRLAVRTP